jgi:hypothetical protein
VKAGDLVRVPFHGGEVIAASGATPADVRVLIRGIVEDMGLDWSSQLKRLRRHPVLREGVVIMTTPSPSGAQETVTLALPALPFWFATLAPSRISDPALRERIVLYQRECADVLFRRFFPAAVQSVLADAKPSAEERQVTGGIIKAVVGKQLADLRAGLLADLRDELGLAAPAEYVSALDWVKRRGVPPKGRRATVCAVSRSLLAYCALHGHRVRRSATGTWLFHADAVAAWAPVGRALLRERQARAQGQGRLRLVQGGRSAGAGTASPAVVT